MKHDSLASMRFAVRDGLAPRHSHQAGHFARSPSEWFWTAVRQFVAIGGIGVLAFAIATILFAMAGAHL